VLGFSALCAENLTQKFEDDPNTQEIDFIDKQIVLRELRSLESYYDWQVRLERNNPIDPQRAYRISSGVLQADTPSS
jgi:hypothetical protein